MCNDQKKSCFDSVTVPSMIDISFYSTIRHSFNYFTADILTKAAGLIYIPVLTRLLTPSEYGIYVMYSSWVPILFVLFTLNTFSCIGRYYYEEKEDFPEFFGETTVLGLAIVVPICIVVLVMESTVSNFLGIPERTIPLLLVAIFITLVSSTFEEIWQAKRKSAFISIIVVIRVYLIMVLTLVLAFKLKTDRYMAPIVSSVIVGSGFIVFYAYHLRSLIKFRFPRKHVHFILAFSLPMLLNNLSGLILERFDTLMIGKMKGTTDAGLYSFAYMIGAILWFGASALYRAWMPVYYKYMNESNYTAHDKDTERLLKIIAIGSCFLIIFGREIGEILANKSYHNALEIIPFITIGYFFLATHDVYKRHFGFTKKTKYLFIAPLISGLLNIVLNLVFIPIYGYMAAAINTLVSYFSMAVIAWFLVKYSLKFHATPVRCLILPVGGQLFVFIGMLFLKIPSIFVLPWQGVLIKFLFLFITACMIFYKEWASVIIVSNREVAK